MRIYLEESLFMSVKILCVLQCFSRKKYKHDIFKNEKMFCTWHTNTQDVHMDPNVVTFRAKMKQKLRKFLFFSRWKKFSSSIWTHAKSVISRLDALSWSLRSKNDSFHWIKQRTVLERKNIPPLWSKKWCSSWIIGGTNKFQKFFGGGPAPSGRWPAGNYLIALTVCSRLFLIWHTVERRQVVSLIARSTMLLK